MTTRLSCLSHPKSERERERDGGREEGEGDRYTTNSGVPGDPGVRLSAKWFLVLGTHIRSKCQNFAFFFVKISKNTHSPLGVMFSKIETSFYLKRSGRSEPENIWP